MRPSGEATTNAPTPAQAATFFLRRSSDCCAALIKAVKIVLIVLAVLWGIVSSVENVDLAFARLVASLSLLSISFTALVEWLALALRIRGRLIINSFPKVLSSLAETEPKLGPSTFNASLPLEPTVASLATREGEAVEASNYKYYLSFALGAFVLIGAASLIYANWDSINEWLDSSPPSSPNGDKGELDLDIIPDSPSLPSEAGRSEYSRYSYYTYSPLH